MARIRVNTKDTIIDGSELVFIAPCDCSTIEGLSVYYPNSEGIEVNTSFVFKDAHGYELSDVDNLFTDGVYVKVILNVTDGVAYIQNADTNKYLEDKFYALSAKIDFETLPVDRGGTGYSSIVDTTYVEARYRASSLHSSEKTPSSNGVICWTYE